MDNTLSWNNHIDLLVKKLSTACYTLRNAKTYMSAASSLKMIFLRFFFYLAVSYGIILWGNLSHSSLIFRTQKKAIRIMEGCRNRVSCSNLFKKLQILPLSSQYMLSLLMFIVQNKNLTNNENHNTDTGQRNNLYLPQANVTIYQRGAYYLGIKIFNNLTSEIKIVAGNQKKFKIGLKKFLYTYSFYSAEEYLSHS